MSKYLQKRYKDFRSYTPGEQPDDGEYIKLNTNESPFPPSPKVEKAKETFDTGALRLYPDPTCRKLRDKLSETMSVGPENIIVTNGSDDILNYAFMAFNETGASKHIGAVSQDERADIVFPDITYSFYEVLTDLHGIKYDEIPLSGSLGVDPEDYMDADANIVIANPNAPTGVAISVDDIKAILESNQKHVVLIDEAYVDFGAETAVSLINEYDNLIVTRTFSKSMSFAGARLGYAVGNEELIRDMECIKAAQSPYSVDSLASMFALASLDDKDYYEENIETIKFNRRYTRGRLADLGFSILPSFANFLFIKHPDIGGEELYEALKERNILVRHFDRDRIRAYNRVTIGAKDEMDALIKAAGEILGA